ncbi:NADH-quinone oxidoreductase subunit C [Clostridium thermarum]|uniref:NADH-quinone oxidoreductase subunit C n=1 Tax=Clostridium thermarum TaxID=1716543 RepID=UPI00111D77C7|nr:NADH-quinone oxidoreductase subunit C [Clostridium thermarum]
MIQTYDVVEKVQLLDRCWELKDKGYRFVALTCEKVDQQYELTYHFDLNYEMSHIRLFAEYKEVIPSISNIFPAAFLIENEYQDLFGLTFEGLIIDYKGHLYLTADGPVMPLA